jgi:hypothetical protein
LFGREFCFVGGPPPLKNGGFQNNESAKSCSQWMGLCVSRITFVQDSRNTFEDVVCARAVVLDR